MYTVCFRLCDWLKFEQTEQDGVLTIKLIQDGEPETFGFKPEVVLDVREVRAVVQVKSDGKREWLNEEVE